MSVFDVEGHSVRTLGPVVSEQMMLPASIAIDSMDNVLCELNAKATEVH